MKYKHDWPPKGTRRPYELWVRMRMKSCGSEFWYYYGRYWTREGAKQSFRTIDLGRERKYHEVLPIFKIRDSRDGSVSFLE